MGKCSRRLLFLVALCLLANISTYGHEGGNSSYLDSDLVLDLDNNFTATVFNNTLPTRNVTVLEINMPTKTSGVKLSGIHKIEAKERKDSPEPRSSTHRTSKMTPTESIFRDKDTTSAERKLDQESNLSVSGTSPFVNSPDLLNMTPLLIDPSDVSTDAADNVFEKDRTTELTVQPRAENVFIAQRKDPTSYMIVGENCTKKFFVEGLASPMADCSVPALFQSYPKIEDLSLYESVKLTTADMVPCRYGEPEQTKYVMNGSITISSDDEYFQKRKKSRKQLAIICIRLYVPFYTVLKLRAENVEEWTKSSTDIAIEFGLYYDALRALAKGTAVRIGNRNEILVVYLFSTKFQNSANRKTFTIGFEAEPECLHDQLDVVCQMESKLGYIQSPKWDGERKYDSNMNTCTTIKPPPGTGIVMISFVMLDLEICPDCRCDRIEIYANSSCTGYPTSKLCGMTDAFPRSYQISSDFSVRFTSDANSERKGFRLLYSFHSSEQQPIQLPGGRWDCSGDKGQLMVKHFICSYNTFCQHSEDRLTGECPPIELCGESSVAINGRCYHFIKPSEKINWEDAMDTCVANEGYLVSLNTELEWRKVVEFWKNETHADYLMVGLRQSLTSDLYSSMWEWEDRTIAYYLNISQQTELSPPHCTAFHLREEDLKIISCQERLKASYLCEIRTHYSHVLEPHLPVPFRRASNISGMTECLNTYEQDLEQNRPLNSLYSPPPKSGLFAPRWTKPTSTGVTHTFLQCDRLSGCYRHKRHDMKRCLRGKPFLTETMFTCTNEKQLVHYTLVCDYHPDCVDGSDEEFCVFPPCDTGEVACSNKMQCIPRDFRCDGISHCVDGTDERLCQRSKDIIQSNIVPPPAIISITGRGKITVTPLNSFQYGSVCPETHFKCPGDGYCLPVYVRCNRVFDCPQGEDEKNCNSYTCPGYYRCRGSQNCVHADHVCDGEFQCPRHDDELMCSMTCPHSCECVGFAFVCSAKFAANLHPELRYLKADKSGMNMQDVADNTLLVYLSLKYCNINEIGSVSLRNIQTLDLSYNTLSSFTGTEIKQMENLRFLSLAFNSLLSLSSIDYLNVRFPFLSFLDMSGISTHNITNTSFLPFPNVEYLNLSWNKVHNVWEPGFSALKELQVLDISECPVTEFYADMFQGLSDIETIYAPKFQMCCPSFLPEDFDPDNCHAPSDEVSSCAALLRADIFRIFLVIYAFFALVGNSISFVYHVFVKGMTTNHGFDIFVTHLCVADFLMGVYLAIVGIADRIYYGTYEWNDTRWKHSVACQVAGFLSLLSSEVSAFLICFITLERFLLIRFPHGNLRFTTKSARMACIIGWMVGVLLAAIPLFPFSPQWDFYSQTGICIPLPVTRKVFPGSDYSFFVMIVFNFILFLLIAVGQILIYRSVHSQRKIKGSNKKAKDMAIARRLVAVAMSDFLCWFPIGLLGLLARSGIPISGDVNVALAIFVLPFNSALNPFLYTFHLMVERRRLARAQRQLANRGDMVSTSCPICAIRNQLQSQDAPSLATAEQHVQSTRTPGGYTAEEVWRLIEELLEEDLTSEFLQLRLTKMIRDRTELTEGCA